ncbi:TPA: carboxypeptidase regulatory-like domain-containing protein [Candidatus Woesearchaeota archaeon]|nr:carboxypeptidase regulatory-like domain-containing protein [Candidatus Woesearchaeota archaeon]
MTLLSILLSSAIVSAGCCIGITGCSRAFMDVECPVGISSFSPNECEDESDCSVVACCHQIAGIPKSTYRSTCAAMTPTPSPIFDIGPFITDPSIRETYANSLCAGAMPACNFISCDGENIVGCQCGSATTGANSRFCCGLDSAVFSSQSTCMNSFSCQAKGFFDVSGTVVTPQGAGIPGVSVRAGGKQAITDASGAFTIFQLPDQSAGSIVAIKNNSINTTTYFIDGADVTGKKIVLVVGLVPVVGGEICDNGKDDDGDQFNWNSQLLEDAEHSNAADWCDSDCHVKGSSTLKVAKSVSRTYYRYSNEWASQSEDFCSDNIDNDCDGYTDCLDQECADNSPACKPTFCGDGVIQFPNAFGEFEQCDSNVTGQGDDALCPGKCIPAGQPNQCHCLYDAVCGNGIIDEPLEDCDGFFIASQNRWDPPQYNTGSDCTIEFCGLPNSPTPCQCPPPQICGNGVKEEPEECDNGGLPGAKSPPDRECPESGECSPNCRCPPRPIQCGNNLLEYGEDCDGTYEPLTNVWTSFKARKYGCSKQTCAPPLDRYLKLQDGTEIAGRSEETYNDLLLQIGADGPCKCATVCKLQPTGANLTQPTTEQYTRVINLFWEDECMDENLKTYNVIRCEAQDLSGAGCDADSGAWTVINDEPLGITQEYSDTRFMGSTADKDRFYCYRVEGIYETLNLESRSVKSPYDPTITVSRPVGKSVLSSMISGLMPLSSVLLMSGRCVTLTTRSSL